MNNLDAIILGNEPFQLFRVPIHHSSTESLQPEKRLMLAVLEQAVEDFRTYAFVTTGRARFLFMDAAAWFCSTATRPFDFEGICQATDLEPDCIRKSLREWYDSTASARCNGRGTKARNVMVASWHLNRRETDSSTF